MSWRLETRDLSGKWQLSESELLLVHKALIDTQKETDQVTQWTLEEVANFILNQGLKWFESNKTEELSPSESLTSAPKKKLSKRLTPRLKSVMDLHCLGHVNLDLGTDHAHLPMLLVKSNKSPIAFGVDIAESPLKHAYQELKKTNTLENIALVLSNGIEAFTSAVTPFKYSSNSVVHSFSQASWNQWEQLKKEKKITVTICGVGGALAAELIQQLPTWISEIIVQANDQEYLVDEAFAELAKSDSLDDSSQFYYDMITTAIEKNRLFLNKRARRYEGSRNIFSDKSFDSNHALWRWVLLSRASRRFALTPKSHHSSAMKMTIMQRTVKDFFHYLSSSC